MNDKANNNKTLKVNKSAAKILKVYWKGENENFKEFVYKNWTKCHFYNDLRRSSLFVNTGDILTLKSLGKQNTY